MRAFSITGAEHFVNGFKKTGGPPPFDGVLNHLESRYSGSTTLSEGNADFDEFRDCLLRECDRYLFLSASAYMRSIDGLRSSSSSWCVVGLYYSSFYAAHAILGMLGCWYRKKNRWVEVVNSNPGSQVLRYSVHKYSIISGSHRELWNAYYNAVANLANWLPAQGLLSVTPMSSNPIWFIELRNRVNYDPLEGFQLCQGFESNFDESKIPACFPGELNSAHQVATSFLFTLNELTRQTGLATDMFLPNRTRKSAIKQRVNGPKNKSLSIFAKTMRPVVEF